MMDAVLAVLTKGRWVAEAPLKGNARRGEPDRPVYSRGEWRVVVGPVWTTYYRKVGKEYIEDIASVRTADAGGVRETLENLR